MDSVHGLVIFERENVATAKKKNEDPAATFAAAGGGRDDVFAIAVERLRHSVTLPFRHVQMVISAVLTRAGPPIRVLKAIV